MDAQTTTRGHPDRAYGNIVRPSRTLRFKALTCMTKRTTAKGLFTYPRKSGPGSIKN